MAEILNNGEKMTKRQLEDLGYIPPNFRNTKNCLRCKHCEKETVNGELGNDTKIIRRVCGRFDRREVTDTNICNFYETER